MILKARFRDAAIVSGLAAQLWPDHSPEEMTLNFQKELEDPQCGLFLAYFGTAPIGFAQCRLRHDYVEGTDSSPVGYLEGIYVLPDYRNQGHARALLSACEHWAAEMGCREFASDCELTNQDSLIFHIHCGFAEANRIICFTKKL